MSEISVRPLAEDDWELFRSVRLDALRESPEAFVATVEEEQSYDESMWRARMARSVRMLAEVEGTPVGIVSLGQVGDESPTVAELFGLWVSPARRGSGVAAQLVTSSADHARSLGRSHLAYWVGTDNGRAVAFASSFGFRPTDNRRPMRVASDDDGEEEIAMVLPLGEDRNVPSL